MTSKIGDPLMCRVCQRSFTRVSSKNFYCSPACRKFIADQRRRAFCLMLPAETTCSECGTCFDPNTTYSGSPRSGRPRRFCSNLCQGRNYWTEERRREHDLRSSYGISPKDYQAMFDNQGGRCLICRRSPNEVEGRRQHLCVDHDHVTGEVRGLLCSPCNLGLGFLADSTDLLHRALQYLRGELR